MALTVSSIAEIPKMPRAGRGRAYNPFDEILDDLWDTPSRSCGIPIIELAEQVDPDFKKVLAKVRNSAAHLQVGLDLSWDTTSLYIHVRELRPKAPKSPDAEAPVA